MKVYFSGYRNHWLSPYTILEKVFYWREIDYDEPIIEKWSNRLSPLCVAAQKFLDFVHPKIEYVKIDRYDTWSMDHTLGRIVLPMLKQLKASKHGAPYTDDEDVPDGIGLRSTEAPAKENEWDIDDNHFKRWDWVIDEMIFAFQCELDDSWEEAFREGVIDWKSVACAWDENGKPTMYSMEDGPNNTYKCDYDGMKVVQTRIRNGFCLFGKYYQNLWD